MNELKREVGGSKSKAEVGEKDFLTLNERLSNAKGGWSPNSYGVSCICKALIWLQNFLNV